MTRHIHAESAGPMQLLEDLASGLLVDGAVVLTHGADISPRRLHAAMVSLSRGLSLQWRRRTGRSLGPAGEHLDGEVVVIGLYARVPAPFAERDAGAYQSLWLRAADADPALLSLSGRPGTATLALSPGASADLRAFLAGP